MLKIYQILLLSAVPLAIAQFSIQGPSDGNRQAQGLKYSEDKGIEYSDKSASLGTGDFTIQGATDGNSNFQIQGASDGNTDFQIQGPSHGGAKTYLQGAYDANQGGGNPGSRALEYQDPSGLRVNWRSYGHGRQNTQPQEIAAPQPIQQPRRRQPVRQQNHQPAPLPQQSRAPAPQAQPNYTPFSNAPTQIKQILEYQAQIPYLNAIPEPFRFDAESAARAHAEQFQVEYPKKVQQAVRERQQVAPAPAPAQRPTEGQQYQSRGQYRAKYRSESRQKRQAYQQQQQQQPDLSQYKRISQPAAEPQPRYSTNLPSQLQSILKYQAEIPYDNTANQINYRPDKPYVPQPVQPQQQQQYAPQQPQQYAPQQQQQYAPQQQQQYAPQQQPQYAPQQQPQYAPQPQAQQARPEYVPQYQGNGQGQTQAQGQYAGQTQPQGQYYGQGSTPVRPVSEQQY